MDKSASKYLDSAYVRRCQKRLMEWGAPLSGWQCVYTYDVAEEEENAVKIVELEKEIQQRVQEMVDLRKEIQQTIKAINNDEYETLLEMRYLSFMDWDEIATRLGYSKRNAFNVHGRALSLIHVPQQAERKAS